MILALAVILGFVVSFARHRSGTFDQIGRVHLQSAWLVMLALAMQWPLLRAPGGSTEQLLVQQALFLLSHGPLLIFVWKNRRLAGVLILGLGIICNLAVVLANGGLMPIAPETLVQINPGSSLGQWEIGLHYAGSKDVILPRQATALWTLSDVLVAPPPFPWPTAFSLGDLIIAVGVVVLLQGPSPVSSEPVRVGT